MTRAITNPVININLPPNGDPTNPAANGDLGPGPGNFGQSFISTTYDPNLSQGWGKRPYNWEYSAAVQQELVPRVSLEAGYFRRTFYNQTVTNNLDITAGRLRHVLYHPTERPGTGPPFGGRQCN